MGDNSSYLERVRAAKGMFDEAYAAASALTSSDAPKTVRDVGREAAKQAKAQSEELSGLCCAMEADGWSDMSLEKAVWPTSYVDKLPDSAFLYVAPGGSKDADGKTTPRSLRHFPVKDHDGKVDAAHVRDALSRIPQSSAPQGAKDAAKAHAQKLLEGVK